MCSECKKKYIREVIPMSEVIRISNGKLSALIRPEGGQIVSCTAPDGREVIWQADPAIWADHTPILFPVISNCKDGSVIIDGKTYPMTKHGFARKAMFTPAIVGENYVTLELTESPATLKMYPFAFVLQITYELTDNGFRCIFEVENQSEKPMPFCVGGHPAFVLPMEDGAAFEDYKVIFPDDEEVVNLLCPGGQLITGSEKLVFKGSVLNLSHAIFDEKDTLQGKRLFCMTSSFSFSNGNLVPCMLKESGVVTMLGRTSGGGSCIVQPVSSAWGTVFQISGAQRMSFLKNGSFYDIDQGIDPDVYIDNIANFYDREALTDYIKNFFKLHLSLFSPSAS